jgi:hypothetical protein
MHLPNQWSQVTLEQYIEFSKIDKSQGAYYYNSEALSILLDEPIEIIEDSLSKPINGVPLNHLRDTSMRCLG